jgi:hypothetical protein
MHVGMDGALFEDFGVGFVILERLSLALAYISLLSQELTAKLVPVLGSALILILVYIWLPHPSIIPLLIRTFSYYPLYATRSLQEIHTCRKMAESEQFYALGFKISR